MRLGPALAAISLALAWGDPGHAAGVFLPVGSPAPASSAAQASAAGARPGRFVRIAHNELHRARAEVGNFGRSHLLFNMSERLELDVAVERTARTLGGYTLSGNIDGGKGGFVTLAVHDRTVAGSIWTWEANYEIAPVGGGVHAVRQVMDEPVECAGVLQAQPLESAAPVLTKSTNSEAVVDILVFWTPDRERRAGGETAVRAEIDLAIAFTNDAFERSGALVSLNLVGAELLDFEEFQGDDSLSPLELDISDRVHYYDILQGADATQRAEALGADFVNLSIASGLGSALSSPSALSVAGPYVRIFAHEIGHNLGLAHDRATNIGPILTYNGGYSLISTVDGWAHCHTTIMAYPARCKEAVLPTTAIPYYASPNRYHPLNGRPLGVSRLSNRRDWDGPADAVLAINRLRRLSADIREPTVQGNSESQ